jgi:hypothetical protein
MEHPDRKATQTATRVARTAIISNSRPLSADDIQKAKLRASYMQQKHGKTDVSKTENDPKLLFKPDANKPAQVPILKVVNKPDIDPLNMMERLKHAQVRWRTPPGTSELEIYKSLFFLPLCPLFGMIQFLQQDYYYFTMLNRRFIFGKCRIPYKVRDSLV